MPQSGSQPNKTPPRPFYQARGYCPACETRTRFVAQTRGFRASLKCTNCRSVPRERALANVLGRLRPDWRKLKIHESSPAPRGISVHLAEHCENYVATNYYPDQELGEVHKGYRCENLEAMTFADNSVDVHVHLDVMEHVNHPDRCVREMMRTLKPGGLAIFTTPVEADLDITKRVATYTADGVEHHEKPEYHGNPAIDGGALVTFKYGQDLAQRIKEWEPEFNVQVFNTEIEKLGVMGPYLDVFALIKPGGRPLGWKQRLRGWIRAN
ncbi:Methyltransferase domain-containing protein [Shimia gijangensis]|uniref:Methyltransferase domain-containing protein n=1 Tax=Shimia gijangensis TaxID=1470563 RepID=A0A1M6BDA4_9RHOB|nr:class I SAM-dependent methyltransferase [Shimia gijangensis]SHI46538.1 Methyltransferase domain-containing protein [Shimia gijangensis]